MVFSTECVTIGAFRCATDHPSFRNSGPIRDDCFVFPRTAVVIQHEHGRPFVADPTIVTLYNRHQQYERRPVSVDGDRCDWFAVSPEILRSALLRPDPAAADEDRPIRFTHAPADATTYLTQRRLFVQASEASRAEPLDVEEQVVTLLDRVLECAYAGRATRSAKQRLPPDRDLADATKRWLAPRIGQRLTLARIARSIGCSVFHLCRMFPGATGLTLHAYCEQLRLRLALERLEGGERDLSRLALDVGYSSHSHFTAAFRRSFGAPPSSMRKLLIVRG